MNKLFKNIISNLLCRALVRHNTIQVRNLINAPADGLFSSDDIDILSAILKNIKADNQIKRGGKVIYTIPTLADVTIQQVQTCRILLASKKDGIVDVWCGEKFNFVVLGDLVKAQAFIMSELDKAYQAEAILFGSSGNADQDTLSLNLATLRLYQIIADAKRTTVDEAVNTTYNDALLILKQYANDSKNNRPN